MKLKKKGTALITGASSGIGYELAKVFAAEGYSVVLLARSEDKLNQLKAELEKTHDVSVTVLVHDLSIPDEAKAVVLSLKRRKIQIDVLVNNAGFGKYGPFFEVDWKVLSEMIQVNITALTQLTHLLLPGMIQRKQGRILNVASTAAFQPGPLMATYYASKAFVLHFSEAIANELKGTGVTVTSLCPGPTASNFQNVASLEGLPFMNRGGIPSSQDVAQYGFKAMEKGKGVAIYGTLNRILVRSVRLMPRSVATSIVRTLQEKKVEKPKR